VLLHGNSHNHSVCKGKGQISVTKISTLAVFHSQHRHLISLVASIIRQLLVLQTISSPQFAKMACGYRAVMALINNHKATLSMRLEERHVTVANQQFQFMLECHY